MPQPRSGAASNTGTGAARKTTARKTTAKKAPAKKAPAKRAASTRAAASKSTASKSTASKRTTRSTSRSSATKSRSTAAKSSSAASDARLEALANRVRKLNERIIDAGREAGESTLTSYEKALKAIASGIEKGPGRSDIDWLAHLATSQAKFIRELTDSWSKAARGVLKS